MSKTRRRKKNKARPSAGNAAMRESRSERAAPANLAAGVPGMRGPSLQNTVFSLMVALGCLGLALFFIFFYAEDANHYLYGGIAGLTALGWLVISVRRWSSYRQSVH